MCICFYRKKKEATGRRSPPHDPHSPLSLPTPPLNPPSPRASPPLNPPSPAAGRSSLSTAAAPQFPSRCRALLSPRCRPSISIAPPGTPLTTPPSGTPLTAPPPRNLLRAAGNSSHRASNRVSRRASLRASQRVAGRRRELSTATPSLPSPTLSQVPRRCSHGSEVTQASKKVSYLCNSVEM